MKIILIAILPILGLSEKLLAQPSFFKRIVIDSTVQFNSHKPKVFARFSNDLYNDLGSLDNNGFKLYRYSEGWKSYTIFNPGDTQGFEDAVVADINGDG